MLTVALVAFNQITRLSLQFPTTNGGNFACTAGCALSLDGAETKTTGVIRCDQPRTIDMAARHGQRLERLPDGIINDVLARLTTILF